VPSPKIATSLISPRRDPTKRMSMANLLLATDWTRVDPFPRGMRFAMHRFQSTLSVSICMCKNAA
jgi:hypothetical protein